MVQRQKYRSTTREQLEAIYCAYEKRLALDAEIAQARRQVVRLMARRARHDTRWAANAIGVSQKVVKYYWNQLQAATDSP